MCRKNKLEIITVAASYQLWSKNDLVFTPFQILKAFKMADFIVTDTFHGTIFSAKFAKRYAVIIRNSNQCKLGDLVNRIGIENHVFSGENTMEKIYETVNDFEKIRSIEKNNYKKTWKYLEENIK